MKWMIAILVSVLPLGATFADQMTAMRSGCMGCHQPDKATVGPAIKDIAAKHKGGDVDALVAIVKRGRGADELSWGTTPMPASPVPEADVRTVIVWMLTQ